VDALIRIMGVLVLVFGAALLYSTYANASALNVQEPVLVPIYYALGILLLLAGLVAAFAKFKG
jgi:membrane-bound ClpP family serine protease